MSYTFERNGRRRKALVVVGAVWAGLLGLWLVLDAADWIVAVALAFTLPALWDYATDRRAGMALSDTALTWHSGPQQGDVALDKIDKVRLERRFDGTVRARLVLGDGSRLKLPQDCLPPSAELERALEGTGLRVERHPFSLL